MQWQITLTVDDGKRIIAKGIALLPEVKTALEGGRILFKGGTTVSAVCEELCGFPLRISGRITPRGTVTAKLRQGAPHSLLLEKQKVTNIDDSWPEVLATVSKADLFIIGANAIDNFGHAAMMIGGEGGGAPGRHINSLIAEGMNTIVAVGLEKLVPYNLIDILQRTGRKKVDHAYGAGVGLMLIPGRILTEIDAMQQIAQVDCFCIGKGGVTGAEGSTTVVVEGSRPEVEKVRNIYESIKNKGVSGSPESLEECEPGCDSCKMHRACIYKKSEGA